MRKTARARWLPNCSGCGYFSIDKLATEDTEDIALAADDAIAAAQALWRERVAVIGGDVFYETLGGFELAYAMWHCAPHTGENVETFVARSVQEACDYIRGFRPAAGKTALFALTVAQVF